jgi:hypothetical protein
MSGFCVFGVTMEQCIEKARKKVKSYDKEAKRHLEVEEYNAKVEVLARELFATGKGAKQISPAFDAPQFARDWIELAKKTIQSHSIRMMARGEKIDDKGGPVLRKGKPVIGWTPYQQ